MYKNKALFFFLVKAFALCILWNVIYTTWITPHTKIDQRMTSAIASVSSKLMNWWGYNVYYINYYEESHFQYSEIMYNNEPLVLIGNPCNGLSLIVLFIGFIIAYPGNWKVKIIYSLIGSILICLINLIRVLILIFNKIYYQTSFEFNHKYTFTVAVYLCIFALWMMWVNYFSRKKNDLNFFTHVKNSSQ